VKDLLRFADGGSGNAAVPSLAIREEAGGTVTVTGLSRHEVDCVDVVSALLYQGALCRATASTNMNTHSSRWGNQLLASYMMDNNIRAGCSRSRH